MLLGVCGRVYRLNSSYEGRLRGLECFFGYVWDVFVREKPHRVTSPLFPNNAHLLLKLSSAGIEGLNEGGCVAQENGVAGGSDHHRDDRQPDFGGILGRAFAITDTQHVRQCFEKRPCVLLIPVRGLPDAEAGRAGKSET